LVNSGTSVKNASPEVGGRNFLSPPSGLGRWGLLAGGSLRSRPGYNLPALRAWVYRYARKDSCARTAQCRKPFTPENNQAFQGDSPVRQIAAAGEPAKEFLHGSETEETEKLLSAPSASSFKYAAGIPFRSSSFSLRTHPMNPSHPI
jgi:hypothetical protein